MPNTTHTSTHDAVTNLCDWPQLDKDINTNKQPITVFKQALQHASDVLQAKFKQQVPVSTLVRKRSEFIDQLLTRAWLKLINNNDHNIALVAVGGYGRGELHPASDIDLLILVTHDQRKHYVQQIEQFLMLLWDIGLEVGHSVRTLQDCIEQGKNDITIATNLMEARLIYGDVDLFNAMSSSVGPDHIWPGREFFKAKHQEQIERHHRFGDTAYNLEPNIKENPGGLRDIQVIGWVAKRHFGAATLRDLIQHGFLTEDECKTLEESQNFLWKIRFGLHILTGRREDRLLIDHQRALAEQFGYHDSEHRLAVEIFMKDYYRTVMELNRLNEMLLQLFDEVILTDGHTIPITPINKRFQSRNGYVEVTNKKVFSRYPFALLEIFLIMQQQEQLKGVRAETIRLIRAHCYLIDEEFRNDVRCHALFMEIFRQPHGLTHELRRMNRYGILAAYIPVFANIVGQMQHDLFHVYTVDEHTMFLVRNLRRFTVQEFAHEFPLCSDVSEKIPKPELLYLAGFFHDIAKGRGGDHSELGALDATEFCQHHGISQYDTKLVAWLVKSHLLFSATAQRKDISDPDVIHGFANLIGSQERLDYLYLLTVADVRATSAKLWNDWKNSLFAELYRTTSRAFRRGLGNPESIKEKILEHKERAQQLLIKEKFSQQKLDHYWSNLEDDYFIRHSVDEIVWHATVILGQDEINLPIILVREKTHRGGTELFVCAKDIRYVFASITATLGRLCLNITDARITTSRSGYTLDTFILLEQNGKAITNSARIEEIIQELKQVLTQTDLKAGLDTITTQSISRQHKHFPISTTVFFRDDEKHNRTILEVVTQDRPGLLATIATTLGRCDVRLQNAKIATYGERAEDIFFVTNTDQTPILDIDKRNLVASTLKSTLDEET